MQMVRNIFQRKPKGKSTNAGSPKKGFFAKAKQAVKKARKWVGKKAAALKSGVQNLLKRKKR